MQPIAFSNWKSFLFHSETFRFGSVSRRGSDIRVTGRAYAATRQSKNCEVLIRSATSLLQSELRVFAGVDRLQFVGVGTADFDRWRFDKRSRHHLLER